ncbi:hypothetical protein C7M84_013431 [Penaeus vannamei]|uniref:FUN14 domain-containing protein 1 n=1 Tax=Penaeus vannamei TaxID=6689 RepID=A0A423SW32_PENVA|nr:hypothetical protein C7M84_013431 [Penaeus vannamei]
METISKSVVKVRKKKSQSLIFFIAGRCYLSMKVGKVAATVVGGSMIIMQLAAHKGYIKVDWNRLNKDLEKNAKKLKREVESNVNGSAADQAVRFARENIVLASSFGGGVLLGIASS